MLLLGASWEPERFKSHLILIESSCNRNECVRLYSGILKAAVGQILAQLFL